jgi:hypothetical protein
MANVSIPNIRHGNVFICDNSSCGEIHIKTKTGKIKPLSSMCLNDWSEEGLTEFAAVTQNVVKLLKRVSENSRKSKN